MSDRLERKKKIKRMNSKCMKQVLLETEFIFAAFALALY